MSNAEILRILDLPPEDEVEALYARVSNWGRWGTQDQAGTLNLITPLKQLQGLQSAQHGLSISCAMPIDTVPSDGNRNPAQHYMISSSDVAPKTGYAATADYIGLAPHGPSNTHLDALCHCMFDGKLYNDFPGEGVTSRGAKTHGIETCEHGLVTRGVLLDMPAVLGVNFLEPEHPVRRSELELAEAQLGFAIEEGDALLIRLGRHVRRSAQGISCEKRDGVTCLPGLHPDCLTWLHDKGASIMVSDAAHDIFPNPYVRTRIPLHVGSLVFMGMQLVDNAYLDDLAAACHRIGQHSFLFTFAPLRLKGATGSPINPIAIL